MNSPHSLTVKHPHVISFTIKLKLYKLCTEQRTHHSSPVLGAFPYSPRQLGNSHAVWIFVRIRAPSTNFASFGSSAYPQAERDPPPPPVLAGLRWVPFQWLSTRGKFEHQRRWRESARGLERGPRGSQVCQDMSRQPAAELRSYGRQLRRISLPLFPTPPSRSGWGRGGDVRAPPRPRLPGADRVLLLQPVAAKDVQAAASFPAAVIFLTAAVPLLSAESPGSVERRLLRTHHRISQPGLPVALASQASIPGPAAFPTPRTAGDALPLLQLKFISTCPCRLPGFFFFFLSGQKRDQSLQA